MMLHKEETFGTISQIVLLKTGHMTENVLCASSFTKRR